MRLAVFANLAVSGSLACFLATSALAQNAPAIDTDQKQTSSPLQVGTPSTGPAPTAAKPGAAKPASARPTPAPATECDRLTGMPLDRDIISPDVTGLIYRDYATTQEKEAIAAACRQAIQDYPAEMRFPLRLGLALKALGRSKDALAAFEQAARLGSLGGVDEQAFMMTSSGVQVDIDAGLKLRRDAIAGHDDPELLRSLAVALQRVNGYRDQEALRILKQLSDRNYPPAIAMLGEAYIYGDDKAGTREDGIKLFERAVDLGSVYAARRLGTLYQSKDLGMRDEQKAVHYYQIAAERGDAEALNYLGVAYEQGTGIEQDRAKALNLYRQAAQRGVVYAMANLGRAYDYGRGVPVDYAEARKWRMMAAERGDAGAMTGIGMQYDHGHGVPQDMAEARRWYEKAAALGDASAFNNMGYLFQYGRAAAVDYQLAKQWYEKAMAANEGDAFNNMADLYQNGLGVEKDPAKGFQLLQRSAELGSEKGTNNLAMAYYRGEGVGEDKVKARQIFEQAVELDSPEAKHNLAGMLENGEGGPKDLKEATRLFKQAALQNNFPNAYYRYAMRVWYDQANDGKDAKASAEAREWLDKAVGLGDEHGLGQLARMTARGLGGPADPEEGRRLYERAAADSSEAKRDFADELHTGRYLKRDDALARRLYTELLGTDVERGYDGAAIKLSRMMERGEGGPKDEKGATALIRKQADKNDSAAQIVLVEQLLRPKAGKQGATEARRRLTAAALLGKPWAFGRLGELHERGIGGPVDLAQAGRLYRAGAASYDSRSIGRLSEWLRKGGPGLKRDPAGARALLEGAEFGLAPAARLVLAQMYDRGEGGPADPERAARLILRNIALAEDADTARFALRRNALKPATRQALVQLSDPQAYGDGNAAPTVFPERLRLLLKRAANPPR